MKKNKWLAYSVLGIAFVLFNIIAFTIPTEKTPTLWIAYAFTVISFALQISIWNFAFKGTDSLQSKFLGIPLISVGVIYLMIQIIVFAIFMTLPTIPSWIAIVACVLILGISAICLIGTETGRDEINRADQKVKKKVFYIKSLQAEVEMLANAESDINTKKALIKLAEKIRFSDPMSSDELVGIEMEITDKISELKTAKNKTIMITVLEALLTERNNKIQLLK